jgi:tRNA A37 threonylcarbamoyladenosine synthetase subunit TsaC/SUA5/YrdC
VRHTRSLIANALIAALNHPLISTSANISGSPTSRSGIEVFGTMDGRVDLVLDGGACVGEGTRQWISPSRTGGSSSKAQSKRKKSPRP